MSKVCRAVYGSIVVPRGVCPDCQEWAFIIRGRYACCDLRVAADPCAHARFERMSEGCFHRTTPSPDQKAAILEAQGHRCFYCKSAFGDVAHRHGLIRVLQPCWDHVEPFCWQANNQVINFVAACAICNGIKSSKLFDTKEQARAYVLARRKAKGWASATEMEPAA